MSEETIAAREGMEKALEALSHEFAVLRTGRASANQLGHINIDYYGTPTPITQVAAVKTPEAHLLTGEPWDKGILADVEKAILASDLGVTPNNDGTGVIRLPFPAPTEERRKEIVKECKAAAEGARVSIRSARRDAKSKLEKAKKAGDIGEDDLHRLEGELQMLTDDYVAKVDSMLEMKESEVMEI